MILVTCRDCQGSGKAHCACPHCQGHHCAACQGQGVHRFEGEPRRPEAPVVRPDLLEHAKGLLRRLGR